MTTRNKYSPKSTSLEFQSTAIARLKDQNYGAIFYEQGLGKTKIAIDLLLHWINVKAVDKVFIIVKKNLINNWYEELKKHSFILPDILTNKKNINTNIFLSKANVIILSYELIVKEFDRLENQGKTHLTGIILDESAKIKNPNSIISQKLHHLAKFFNRKIIMTGTPSANRPEDYWSQIYFLDKGKSLGTDFKAFQARVKISNKLRNDQQERERVEKNVEQIFGLIEEISIRETKKSTKVDLPEKIYKKIQIDFEPLQKEIYETALNQLKTIVLKDDKKVEEDLDDFLKKIIRLMQITSNPLLLDKTYSKLSNKLLKTIDLVSNIANQNEKVIVWTSYKFNVEYLLEKLSNFNPTFLHGSLDNQTRIKNINNFKKNKDVKVLIATPQSSKEGLTLVVANHCIYFDRTLSLDDYLQSQDRIHRIGQTKQCYYYNLIIKNSIDDWIDQLVEAKSLFAQLSLGDLKSVDFKTKIRYNFGNIIREILKLQ